MANSFKIFSSRVPNANIIPRKPIFYDTKVLHNHQDGGNWLKELYKPCIAKKKDWPCPGLKSVVGNFKKKVYSPHFISGMRLINCL